MNESIAAPARAAPATPPRTARLALALLARLPHGRLDLTLPDGARLQVGAGAPQAALTLHDWSPFAAAARSGDVGFAERYIDGAWDCPDLVALLRYCLRNREALERLVYGSFWGSLLYRVRHLLRGNRRAQARRNIAAHYDLGNAFYALWLDETMTYSSALFPTLPAAGTTPTAAELAAAQRAKHARALAQLALAPGARVLEIGCGWGAFAQQAAQAGLQIKGLTLSAAQRDYARARLAQAGLQADIALQDYRDERGIYDGIVSIEMFEAVGERYWPAYFATLARCLRPGGRAVVQTIEIADALFARYRRSTDFIQQYVFPGGMLPSPSAFRAQAQRAGLRVLDAHSFGAHYAATLAAWRARFEAQREAVLALGFDARFLRLWRFYLAYCEAAFAESATDVTQYTLARA